MTALSGTTKINTEVGKLSLGQIATLHNVEFGFQEYKGPSIHLENGYRVKPKFFYIQRPERLIEITLLNGQSLNGLFSQSILTKTGYSTFFNIKPHSYVAIVRPYYDSLCNNPTVTDPVHNLLMHPDYLENNFDWVQVISRKVSEVEPSFSLAVPYYNRFIANACVFQG